MYTEYLFDAAYIEARKAEFLKNLEAGRGTRDLVRVGTEIIADFLSKKPQRYRDFGPYWWALKEILIERGLSKGETMDIEVGSIYRGSTQEDTLVMSQLFSDLYRGSFLIGSNRFQLDPDDPNDYVLYDPDYEVSAA